MDQERAERLRVIATEMDSIMREVGPKWIRLAHLKKEAEQIIAELTAQEDDKRD